VDLADSVAQDEGNQDSSVDCTTIGMECCGLTRLELAQKVSKPQSEKPIATIWNVHDAILSVKVGSDPCFLDIISLISLGDFSGRCYYLLVIGKSNLFMTVLVCSLDICNWL